jgi:hypothetical protein
MASQTNSTTASKRSTSNHGFRQIEPDFVSTRMNRLDPAATLRANLGNAQVLLSI